MIVKRMKAMAVVTAAAIALTSASGAPAFAGAKPQAKSEMQGTEFSSRNRGPHYGYAPRHRNDAAAAAIIGSVIAGVAAYAAAREYRKARERGGYGYGPYAPVPYGNPYY